MKLATLVVLALVASAFGQVPPPSADLRSHQAFQGCTSVSDIQFEGVCSSSYAITVATVASDTVCAQNKTEASTRISYQNIMECCSNCFKGYENGCYGGSYTEAIQYLVSTGAVTGSSKVASNTCKNYKLAECYHNPDLVDATYKLCGSDALDFDQWNAVGKCDKSCEGNSKVYNNDIKKGFAANQVKTSEATQPYSDAITSKLSASNPQIVITEMAIFEDIYTAKKDEIYVHLYGKFIGTTTVAILGYAKDSNTQQDYWIVRFPWGRKFGENGFLKVQKGTNNCGIENVDKAWTLTYTPPAPQP